MVVAVLVGTGVVGAMVGLAGMAEAGTAATAAGMVVAMAGGEYPEPSSAAPSWLGRCLGWGLSRLIHPGGGHALITQVITIHTFNPVHRASWPSRRRRLNSVHP